MVTKKRRSSEEVDLLAMQLATELKNSGEPISTSRWASEHGVTLSTLNRRMQNMYGGQFRSRGTLGIQWKDTNGKVEEKVEEPPNTEMVLAHESRDFIVFKYRGKVWGARPI